jgi:hypothetical protein
MMQPPGNMPPPPPGAGGPPGSPEAPGGGDVVTKLKEVIVQLRAVAEENGVDFDAIVASTKGAAGKPMGPPPPPSGPPQM